MSKGEGVVPYLTRLTQIRVKLGAVGSKIEDEELVHIALNGFSKPWDTVVKGVVAREKLPDWQRLWDDFVQDETCMGQGSSSSSSAPQIVDEEALALIGHLISQYSDLKKYFYNRNKRNITAITLAPLSSSLDVKSLNNLPFYSCPISKVINRCKSTLHLSAIYHHFWG